MGDNLKPEKHGRDHCPGGEDPIPCLSNLRAWVRRTNGDANLTVQGTALDDEETLGRFAGNEPNTSDGSTDYLDYFSGLGVPNSYQITLKQHGIYEVYAEAIWTTGFDGPAWFYVHDGVGYPVAMAGHSRPTRYGQLSSTSAGFWSFRSVAFKTVQVDIAQLSGSNKVVAAWYIEVRYVSDYTGPEREDSLEWDQ